MQAVYEEVLRAGGLPIMQLSTEGAVPAFYELASESSSTGSRRTAQWAAENADVRIAVMADANPRELSQVDPKQAGARAEGAQAADGDESMRRAADGRATAGRSRCSRPRPTRPRRACRWPPTRTSTTAPAWHRRATRSTAWQRQSDEVKRLRRVDGGQGGGPHHGARHRHHAGRGRAHVHPVRRRAQHARRRVLHRPDRGLGEGRGRLLVPGDLRRPRGGRRQVQVRGRQGRGRLAPSAARTS